MNSDPWIATTNMKSLDQRPEKPRGMWRCRACSTVQHGSTLYRNERVAFEQWTCSNLFCGGVCDQFVQQTGEPTPCEQLDKVGTR